MNRATAAASMGAVLLLWSAAAPAQSTVSQSTASQSTAKQHYDLNVYPALTNSGPYDLTAAPVQTGPAGTITMTSAAPAAAYSFKDMLANTHGYVSTGVSSRGGYGFEGGVSLPILPGKVDLEVGGGTGQTGNLPRLNGTDKHTNLTYDSYYAALHVHPTDDIDATIAISGLRLHGNSIYAYSPYGVP